MASSTNLSSADIEGFAAGLHGSVVRPEDSSYDEVRALYNAMIDKRPALIARCADVDDVVSAVNFGREQGLDIAIRCGGHNGPGLGSVDDGLMIDLSGLRRVEVDPDARTAKVGGGSLFQDIDGATHEHGMATPGGIISTTGAGGLILGGGMGHLSRKCGLSIDNILGAQVALADGSVVAADESTNDDLFWAIKGGGGNFGVATELTMQLHPVATVVAGPMLLDPLCRHPQLVPGVHPECAGGPERLLRVPHRSARTALPGGAAHAEGLRCRLVLDRPGRRCRSCTGRGTVSAGSSLLDGVQPMPLPMLQSAFDVYAAGDQWYWRADFVEEIPDAAIERHVEFAEKLPSWKSTMHMYPIDGAVHRPGPNDTPWGYRNANWGMVIVGVDPDPANASDITAWTKDYWEALHPYSAGGAYVNMMMEEGQERVQAAYGENYDRLAEIKAAYDPGNVFHVNQNIRPAA